MILNRRSGVLLHITSLPGPAGIGDLGPQAWRFAEQLAQAGQSVWQVLPLRPTGYGNSPYQCLSAFAGNPLLISPEKLLEDGLLTPSDLLDLPHPTGPADFGTAARVKGDLLAIAYRNHLHSPDPAEVQELARFRESNSNWLEDYSLYEAVKRRHHLRAWTDWASEIAFPTPPNLKDWRKATAESRAFIRFVQFQFHRQWSDLRRHCSGLGIGLMGDVPIFVAHDSADVWAHRELFQLDQEGMPTEVAGVPPDYFSKNGQLWGNPLYRWERLAEDGYAWWIDRLRSELALVDLLRLDHFRGFQAYWAVPAGESTARKGEWRAGPGSSFFEKVAGELGEIPLIAENLGWITPEVEQLRRRFGLPGMGVMQFAFSDEAVMEGTEPLDWTVDTVGYTGTHDNDTLMGWWSDDGPVCDDGPEAAARKQVEKERAGRLIGIQEGGQVQWRFIQALLETDAAITIVPAQDLLGLGSSARMNRPGDAESNWSWRLQPGQLTEDLWDRLSQLTRRTNRGRP